MLINDIKSRFTITISLADHRFCDGCPCLNSDYENGTSCNLDFFSEGCSDLVWVNKETEEISEERPDNISGFNLYIRRPGSCRNEHPVEVTKTCDCDNCGYTYIKHDPLTICRKCGWR